MAEANQILEDLACGNNRRSGELLPLVYAELRRLAAWHLSKEKPNQTLAATALAMMEHPGIATAFDGGAAETGRLYFVMELVKGVPSTNYCDANRLSTADRLQLYIRARVHIAIARRKLASAAGL